MSCIQLFAELLETALQLALHGGHGPVELGRDATRTLIVQIAQDQDTAVRLLERMQRSEGLLLDLQSVHEGLAAGNGLRACGLVFAGVAPDAAAVPLARSPSDHRAEPARGAVDAATIPGSDPRLLQDVLGFVPDEGPREPCQRGTLFEQGLLSRVHGYAHRASMVRVPADGARDAGEICYVNSEDGSRGRRAAAKAATLWGR